MTDQPMIVEELELFARAFTNLDVTMTWDDKSVTLAAQVGDPPNAIMHAQDGDLWDWLYRALDGVSTLRDLEADGAK